MPKQVSDEQMFTAALETISARGFAGATTKQIAAAAGVNEVTLFRRYGSKAQLIEAALTAEVERCEAGGGARYTGELRADLVRVVELYAQLIARVGRLLPILLAELPRTGELGAVVERPQVIIRAVAGLIRRYQRAGQLLPEPPLQSVAALLGPLMIAAMVTPLETRPQPPDPAEHVERYLSGRAA